MRHAILGRLITVTSLLFQGAALGSSDDELSLIATRRIADLAQFPDPTWFSRISDWLGSQKEDGTWDDVNYLAGCPARELLLYPVLDLLALALHDHVDLPSLTVPYKLTRL